MKVQPSQELYVTEYAAIYIYSFHPAVVVHMYPLTPNPAGDQPTFSEVLVNETNGYGTILLPVWAASSRKRPPGL